MYINGDVSMPPALKREYKVRAHHLFACHAARMARLLEASMHQGAEFFLFFIR
jgi:hypothetical protein